MEFELKGRNGSVKVDRNVVIITHEGMLGMLATGAMGNGEKRILIKNISSVELGNEPSFMTGVSYIRFATAADDEKRNTYHPNIPVMNKAGELFNDPNTIQIKDKEQYEIAKQIRDYIENFNSNDQQVASVSSADELKKFKELLDSGVITQEEFDAKKKQLLGL